MSYLGVVIDWIEDRGFTFECEEDVNDAYQRIDDDWKIVGNRFSIPKLLGINNEFPDLILYLQEQIDDECEDTTETITFPPERVERDEQLEEEILETEIELLNTRKELLEVKIAELEDRDTGIIGGIKRFIRNIFGG